MNEKWHLTPLGNFGYIAVKLGFSNVSAFQNLVIEVLGDKLQHNNDNFPFSFSEIKHIQYFRLC